MRTKAPFSRRGFLVEATALGATTSILGFSSGCGDDESEPPEEEEQPEVESKLFPHGVASGDPLPDAVILWTRVTTEDGAPVEVAWSIATDPDLADEVQSGTFSTSADRDFTVKIDVTGLAAGTTYYYRFAVGEERSVRGRTRTAPAGSVERLRFAVLSCASFAHGYFHVYEAIAKEADLDLVVHLGDYIYEYADDDYGSVRTYDPPNEIVTLEDYRRRYAHYRRDASLKGAHRQHPFVVVWDDHESANNSAPEGAENHDPATEGSWQDRKTAAVRAYSEWMPIRDQADPLRVWRSFAMGDLVDLIMLDTRLWGRTTQATSADDPALEDEERTMLGLDQETWLTDQLRASKATWRLLGQQVMVGRLPQFLNVDQWDGYPAARDRLFDVIATEGVGDVVVLTGDIHSSWAMDLPRDPEGPDYNPATGAGSLAVEFVVPAVTSPGLGLQIGDALELENPWMKFVDTDRRGYVILDVTRERVQAAYSLFEAIDVEEPTEPSTFAAMATYAGTHHVVDDGTAATPREDAPELAP